MSPLTDPDRLASYKDALSNWNYEGYIRFELTETAYAWVKRELDSISLKDIGRLMFESVEAGGEIAEVQETRPEWSDYEFHYDMRFRIQNKPVYVETRLHFKVPFKPGYSFVIVVNLHVP